MKILRVRELLGIFFCLIIFSNSRAMVNRSRIIILDGPTCSGKSSLAQCFMDIVKEKQLGNWVYLAVDDIEEEDDDGDDEDYDEKFLHTSMIKKIKNCVIKKNQSVLCDTVIDDIKWYNLFSQKLRGYNILYVFVHCPLQILVQRLTQRNVHAHASGELRNLRKVSDVMHAYGKMYSKVDQDFGLGTFSAQDFKDIVDSVSQAHISPQDWDQYARRYDVFCVGSGEKFFLKLNIPHDLVVHNYPVMQEVQEMVNHRCVEQILSRLGF